MISGKKSGESNIWKHFTKERSEKSFWKYGKYTRTTYKA